MIISINQKRLMAYYLFGRFITVSDHVVCNFCPSGLLYLSSNSHENVNRMFDFTHLQKKSHKVHYQIMECVKLIVFQGVFFSFILLGGIPFPIWPSDMHSLIGRCVCGNCTKAHFKSTHIYQTIPSHPSIPSVVTTCNSPLFVLSVCTWWILYYINS